MAILRSASGTRIDCDRCDAHVSSPDLVLEQLQRAARYVHVDGQDLCLDCAAAAGLPPAPAADELPAFQPG